MNLTRHAIFRWLVAAAANGGAPQKEKAPSKRVWFKSLYLQKTYAQNIVVIDTPNAWMQLNGYLKSRLNMFDEILPY